jgi:hypothetical protein
MLSHVTAAIAAVNYSSSNSSYLPDLQTRLETAIASSSQPLFFHVTAAIAAVAL